MTDQSKTDPVRNLIRLIGSHAPIHQDELYAIMRLVLFGNDQVDLNTVRFLLSTDGGRSIPSEVYAQVEAGTAVLVGIGGGDHDEHGKNFPSAASMPIEGLRANFNRTLLNNGVPKEMLDECFERFSARTAFTEIRDSTPTGRTWDIADMVKQYGYGRLFLKGPSRNNPLVRGTFTEDDMQNLIGMTRMLMVGWILVPHRLPTEDDIAMIDNMLTGWVLRNLSWQGKPRDKGPHSLESLQKTVSRKSNGVVHQKFRRLVGHLNQLQNRSPWSTNVEFKEMLRGDPQFDGDRAECPETIGNILIMLRRREQPWKDPVLSKYPQAMQDMLRLERGTAARFMNMMLDSWDHTQWLFLVEGRRNAQEAGAVTFTTVQGEVEDGLMAVVLSRGPDTFKHVRASNRDTLEVGIVRNTLLNTTLVSSNREALRTLAIRHEMPIKQFVDMLNRHLLATLRIWELAAEGIDIPWTKAGYPDEVLFCNGYLPETLHPDPKWFGADDFKKFLHSIMNGSLNHADVPESKLSSRSIIELTSRVLKAFHAKDVRVALRALYISFKENTDARALSRSSS